MTRLFLMKDHYEFFSIFLWFQKETNNQLLCFS